MKSYLFYIEGLNREVWQQGISERDAKSALWVGLTSEEQNSVVIFDCIDIKDAAPAIPANHLFAPIAFGMAQTVRLTRANAYENGFSFDSNSQRFI